MKETKKFMLWWYQINLYFFYQHLSIVGIYASTPIIGIKNQQQQQQNQQAKQEAKQEAKQDDDEEEEEKTRRKHSYVLYSIVFITVASSYLFNCHHFKNESDE